MELFKDKEGDGRWREVAQKHNKATQAGGKVREAEEKVKDLKKKVVHKASGLKRVHSE